jgi:lariat debranching enzyme
MRIAIEGCCHGALDKIYQEIMAQGGADLLLICGDFQSVRNLHDLTTMSVPDKYKKMGNFYQYYSGKKKAPIPTIFIGGNHEASNYLHELFYGGWVCPNIYYLGHAGVVTFAGLRIGGMSGIYVPQTYENGYFEQQPLQGGDVKTSYRIRKSAFHKLSLLRKPVDIMMSHDWPRGITRFGDLPGLLKIKGFLRNEIAANTLGSAPAEQLLNRLKPKYWFSAHLHVRFEALVSHSTQRNPDQIDIQDSSEEEEGPGEVPNANTATRFLSLDKCLPNRKFLEILDIQSTGIHRIQMDREWIAILRAMEKYQSFDRLPVAVPDEDTLFK